MYGRLCREHTNTQPIGKFLRRLDVVTARELDRATYQRNNAVELPTNPIAPGSETIVLETSLIGEQSKEPRLKNEIMFEMNSKILSRNQSKVSN